jgi:hypothetical protein
VKEVTLPFQALRPMVADTGQIAVTADDGKGNDVEVRLYDPDKSTFTSEGECGGFPVSFADFSASYTTIARVGGGSKALADSFTELGRSPGVSDDGLIVAFYGNSALEDGTDINKSGGKGIYASVDVGPTKPREVIRVAALRDGFDNFDATARVSINSTLAKQHAVTVVYVATRKDKKDNMVKKGIYASRIIMHAEDQDGKFVTDWSKSITGIKDEKGKLVVDLGPRLRVSNVPAVDPPLLVVEQGEEIPGLGFVKDLNISDAVNNHERGDVVFWVQTKDGKQGIVRAQPVMKAVKYPSQRYQQADDHWKDEKLGPAPKCCLKRDEKNKCIKWSEHKTIGKVGCTLTAITMVLRAYGITKGPTGPGCSGTIEDLTPSTLNKWLIANDGFDQCDNIRHFKVGERFAECAGKPISYKSGLEQQDLYRELDRGNPVIVAVRTSSTNPDRKGKNHYVVAIGQTSKGTVKIHDVGYKNVKLLDGDTTVIPSGGGSPFPVNYHNNYRMMKVFHPKSGSGATMVPADGGDVAESANISSPPVEGAIEIRAYGGDVDFLITDPLGRRAGTDPATGEQVKEILDSAYGLESISNDTEDDDGTATPEMRYFETSAPIEGPYKITVHSAKGTTYLLLIRTYDINGNLLSKQEETKSIGPGQSVTRTIKYSLVVDTVPPTTTASVSPPPNASGWNNSNVTVKLTATDNPDGAGVKQISYSSGGAQIGGSVVAGSSASVTIAAEGTTTLTYFATDNAGKQEAPKTLTVRIDATPPAISTAAASPKVLWPPNDTLVPVSVSIADKSDAKLLCKITKITSNEAVTPADAQITGNLTAKLRAQRLATCAGRTYTLTVQCTDAAGNKSINPVTVTVPRDPPKGQ